MPPLSALEDELQLGVGRKREERWSRRRGHRRGFLTVTWRLEFLPSLSSQLLPSLSLTCPSLLPPLEETGDS